MILDLFAGQGGWDEALRTHWPDHHTRTIGVEFDPHCCATRAAAGHRTIRADAATFPLDHLHALDVEGLIGSPPCQTFSQAGSGTGRNDLDRIVAHAHRGEQMPDPGDPRTGLVLQPARYVAALTPRWVALEQVPAVLPVWVALTHWLRGLGYDTWTGILNAANYGVPQTRRRAILLAHLDRPVFRPEPTHEKDPGLFALERWVTMADALGWPSSIEVGFPRLDDRGDSPDGYRERDWTATDQPSAAITSKARDWRTRRVPGTMLNTGRDWKKGGTREDAQQLDPEAGPAPTLTAQSGSQWHLRTYAPEKELAPSIAFGHDAASGGWERVGNGTGIEDDTWPEKRPATTLAGRDTVTDPGSTANRYNESTKTRNDGYRVSESEALILQGFRPDYPLQGSRTARFRQVGDAVPPGLARAALSVLLDPPRSAP